MKKTWVLLFLLFVSTFTFANHDSSKIYITKNSFINNHADYSSDYFVKEKYWFGWSGFSFQTEGLLRLKLSNGNYKEFSPGSIYGFTTGGIKYIYSSAKNKYFAILSEDKLINFFVGENEKRHVQVALFNEFFILRILPRRRCGAEKMPVVIGDFIRLHSSFDATAASKYFRNRVVLVIF